MIDITDRLGDTKTPEGTPAEVIQFPTPRNCGECAHAALHYSGVFCVEILDFVASESVAVECPSFERT